jgi:hypothetical protein
MKIRRLLAAVALTFTSLALPGLSDVAQAENCGWAMVNADGVSGAVLVGDCGGAFLAEWNSLGLTEGVFKSYGCKLPCQFVIQTRQSETGNVAGYSSSFNQPPEQSRVTYDGATNSFTVSNGPPENPKVSLIIKDGIATDSSGRSFNTGTGVTTSTTLTQEQYAQLVTETKRIDNAKTQRELALNQAIALAAQTPGLERCVTWSGYYENGRECATATSSDTATAQTRSVSNSLETSETSSILSINRVDSTTVIDSVTVQVKAANEFETPTVINESVSITGSLSKVSGFLVKLETDTAVSTALTKSLQIVSNLKKTISAKVVKLPDSVESTETVVSKTPKVCAADGNRLAKLSKGVCRFTYSVTAESGNQYAIDKAFSFK